VQEKQKADKESSKDKYISAAKRKLLNMHGFVDAKRRNQVLELISEDYDRQ
jgi:hypothetical protein